MELDPAGEQLLGVLVADARTAGHSWAEIGGVLGVSRQGAQQRFSEPVIEDIAGLDRRLLDRFALDARYAVDHGAGFARRLGHDCGADR